MKLRRIALSFGLPVLLSLAAGAAFAASSARVDKDVRARLQEGGRERVIVQLGDAAQPDLWSTSWRQRVPAVRALAARTLSAVPQLEVHRRFDIFPFLSATVDANSLRQLESRPEVEAVFPDRPVKAVLDVSGPLIGQPAAQAAGYSGAGVGVAVIDTGIDYTHAAFNPPTAKFFPDVKPGHWAWRQIQALAERGTVGGYPDTLYHPEYPITREQMAVFIARSLATPTGVPDPAPGTQSFPDVLTDSWAYTYIEYCKEQNIVGGYPDGSFAPTQPLDRGQMAAFIARAVAPFEERPGLPSYTAPTTASFPDVPNSGDTAWCYREVEYVKEYGVVGGYPDGKYWPSLACTRDQMAVFISRAFNVTWGGRVIAGVNLLSPSGALGRQDPMDDHYHGTMVSGIVASMDAAYRGVAPAANLIGVKVLDQNGDGYSSDVIAGIQWCMQNKDTYGIKVINLSLGDGVEWTDHESADGQPEGEAVQEAVNAGLFVAVASGNDSFTHGISLPAAASAAVSVGATKDGGGSDTPADAVAAYSNRGELLTLYAPGTHITSLQVGGGMLTGQGTSFAAPHVAGAAAVLASAGIADPLAIRARLAATGTQVVDPLTQVSAPRVNLVTALAPPATGPDLVLTAVGTGASAAFTGDTVELALTVRNEGTAASAACRASVVLSTNTVISNQDALLASVDVPALAAGAQFSPSSFSGTVPAVGGREYHVGAVVDSAYAVAELSEVNNTLLGSNTFRVNVPSASVVSTTIPATMQAGQVYHVTVTLRNDGTTSWAPGEYTLGAVSPEGTTRWGASTVALSTTVAPGGPPYSFAFDITAPAAGSYACHWRMRKGTAYFGEVATGGARDLMVDDTTKGQDYPSASGSRVAFMDYKNGTYSADGVPAVSVRNVTTGTLTVLPDDIPGLINPHNGYPDPPYTYMDLSNNWLPSISGTWVAWMVDDQPEDVSDPGTYWYWQIVAYDFAHPSELPRRVTLQNAEAWFPCVDGNLVVWEDYRNDPDRVANYSDFLSDNPDIYLSDLSAGFTDAANHRTAVYPICTAPGPQLAPRLSGPYVAWEDWRSGTQGDIYCYDLTVDSDGDGTPNWQESSRPSPDPAERRLTDTVWTEGFPDVSGTTAVWLDYSRYTGPGGVVDIVSEDLSTSVETPLVTDPAAYRQQVRLDGTQMVWEDWRTGTGDVYWTDLANPSATALIGGSGGYEGVPDIGSSRIAFSKYRTGPPDNAVYNVWSQQTLPYVTVVP